MRFLVTLLLLFSLCGCETVRRLTTTAPRPEPVNPRLTWIGQSADKLMEEWGIPTQEYKLQNGSRLVSYQKTGGIKTVAGPGFFGTSYAKTDSYHCTTTFTVDDKNIVQNASWEGNGC